jgi:hypothetical protein
MRILRALTRYAESGEGDVKSLEGKFTGTHGLRTETGGFDFAEYMVESFTFWQLRIGGRPTEQHAAKPGLRFW